jgi:hypothetical protein
MVQAWLDGFENLSFRGITTNESVVDGLLELGGDEGAPTTQSVRAATVLLASLSDDQRNSLCHPLDSKVWRAWMNPEFYVNQFGLRLEELDESTRGFVHDLLRAGTSDSGYRKIVDTMRVNGFLGEVVGLPKLLNENSYNLNIFGTPSATEPWGWNLYGHHLCLSTLFIGGQQVFAPVFFGAEPNEIDDGPYAGTTLFREQEVAGVELMAALSPEQREQAVLYTRKRDPAMPEGRVHPGDELHLGGAFQDNRVIPYEGLPIGDASPTVVELVVGLVEKFLDYQPPGPRAARIADVRRHLDQTHLCWIGGTSLGDTFYYRIQSPVIMVEFDHHAGIFLANPEPEHFHIHTVVRFPNANDYGVDLVRRATGTAHTLQGRA